MRNGYILLHRKGITTEEWKHPLRTLAWIDLLTLVSWDDRTDHLGNPLKRGEIVVSESYLASRWRQNRGTIHRWLKYWESQQMVQRVVQQQSQQVPQRLFVVNYAKYQEAPQRVSQQVPQRPPQPIERKDLKESKNTVSPLRREIERYLAKADIENPAAYIDKLLRDIAGDWQAVEKAWREWKRGCGIESASQFYGRCKHWHATVA